MQCISVHSVVADIVNLDMVDVRFVGDFTSERLHPFMSELSYALGYVKASRIKPLNYYIHSHKLTTEPIVIGSYIEGLEAGALSANMLLDAYKNFKKSVRGGLETTSHVELPDNLEKCYLTDDLRLFIDNL